MPVFFGKYAKYGKNFHIMLGLGEVDVLKVIFTAEAERRRGCRN